MNQAFNERIASRKVIFAYHGSRVENFFSILHYGLTGHLNKVRSTRYFSYRNYTLDLF